MSSDIDYKQKYLEYKIKYFNKKNIQSGGGDAAAAKSKLSQFPTNNTEFNTFNEKILAIVKDSEQRQMNLTLFKYYSYLYDLDKSNDDHTIVNNSMLTLANKIFTAADLFGSIDRTIRITKLSNDVNGIMLSLILAICIRSQINPTKYTRFQDQLIRAQRTPEYNTNFPNMLAHTASESKVSEPKAANESLQQIRREQIRRGQGFQPQEQPQFAQFEQQTLPQQSAFGQRPDEQMSALHAVARAAAQAEAQTAQLLSMLTTQVPERQSRPDLGIQEEDVVGLFNK